MSSDPVVPNITTWSHDRRDNVFHEFNLDEREHITSAIGTESGGARGDAADYCWRGALRVVRRIVLESAWHRFKDGGQDRASGGCLAAAYLKILRLIFVSPSGTVQYTSVVCILSKYREMKSEGDGKSVPWAGDVRALSDSWAADDAYGDAEADDVSNAHDVRQLNERSYDRPPNDRPPHYLELKEDPPPTAAVKGRRSKLRPKCSLLVKPYGGQTFTECGRKGCEATCANPTPDCASSQDCQPRCECPPHMPLLHNRRCVAAETCPKASTAPMDTSLGGAIGGGALGAIGAVVLVLGIRRARRLMWRTQHWPRASVRDVSKADSPAPGI